MLHNELFFSHNSEQIKNCNKNFSQKTDNSTEILQEHVDKGTNHYDVDKMIKEKKWFCSAIKFWWGFAN